MTALILCAALTADFEFEEISHNDPKYRAVLAAIDRATQKTIATAPREITAMRQMAADESGDFRRRSLSQIRLYEHRLAELKAGRRAVYPRLPFPPKVGDVGILPGPMTVVSSEDSNDYVVEADWNAPEVNLIGLRVDARPKSDARKIRFVYKLGVSKPNGEPIASGSEFEMSNAMQRVVGVSDGLVVIESVSLPEPWELELLSDFRRDEKKRGTDASGSLARQPN